MFGKLMPRRRSPKRKANEASVVALVFIAMTSTVFIGMLLYLFQHSPGEHFGLSLQSFEAMELWRLLTFSLSTFAPVGVEESGASASLLASFLIYCACSGGLMTSGAQVEKRLGTGFTARFLAIVVLVQALTTFFVFDYSTAFSPVAMTLALLTLALLVEFERGSEGRDVMIDARLVATAFILLPVLVATAFEPNFKPMLVGLTIGPVLAICAFAAKQRGEGQSESFTDALERLEVTRAGQDVEVVTERRQFKLEELVVADDFELMPLEQLMMRADELLEKVAETGVESLDDEQKRLLSYASQRLRGTRHGASGGDDADGELPGKDG